MGPCGAGKVRTRVYGPVRCRKSNDTGLWAREVQEKKSKDTGLCARAVHEKYGHGFMDPCGAGKVKTRVYGPVRCRESKTRVYGSVRCRKSKDTGLWARAVHEK
ncbi:hypothetical protein CRG98_036580 [Punica granatum]|uniref:Uncharacterized protein n=1 Tax=Punica granatum TaxID=22663 RepID=A0A2I0IGC3_PUNGR|nr:hypothetical protein CRG98_036580 [Punica granatum]